MDSNGSKSLLAADYWPHLEQGDFHDKTLVKKNHEVAFPVVFLRLAASLFCGVLYLN